MTLVINDIALACIDRLDSRIKRLETATLADRHAREEHAAGLQPGLTSLQGREHVLTTRIHHEETDRTEYTNLARG